MQNMFIGMTLGGDPHTVGIYKAGRIANLAGVDYMILPPDMPDTKKLESIRKYRPKYIGLSYRLSPDNAIDELRKFLVLLERLDAIKETKLCFAALIPTLREVHNLGLDVKYRLSLMPSYEDIDRTTANTASFFDVSTDKLNSIIRIIHEENYPKKIRILDQLAQDVIRNDEYLFEPPLTVPSEIAKKSLRARMQESAFPLIRSHFGVPDISIEPTVEGIRKIALAGAVDEISLGSSDLSQRYYGEPEFFKTLKNDGGVPYKNILDLDRLFQASRIGNFPAMKPYCHVKNIIPFIEDCLKVGMLYGGHQAVPLFWFNELDGRGNMTVQASIDSHIEAVRYLASKGIPVEMNDPNQWSSRFVHDTLFVTDYALISSVMYASGVSEMVIQCQFNKPASTGDYADLAKMNAAKEIVEALRPTGNQTRIYFETRSGIEHFSIDLDVAKLQLARSVLLQMIFNPGILHLVSYCEADHVATADDVIESSKLLRRAVRLFKENENDIRNAIDVDCVNKRKEHLIKECFVVLHESAKLSPNYITKPSNVNELHKYLSEADTLKKMLERHYIEAPGIINSYYHRPELLTKTTELGGIDCVMDWNNPFSLSEEERLSVVKKKYE